MTIAPRPGWYPDPAGNDEVLRWWDGHDWTDVVSDPAHPARPAGRSTSKASVTSSSLKTTHLLLVLTVGFALLVTAGLAVASRPRHGGGQPTPVSGGAGLASASPATPNPAQSATAPIGQLDESSGRASIGSVSMMLPGPPYELSADPMTVPSVFDVLFLANADVHQAYAGGKGWSAVVGLAQINTASRSDDLERVGTSTLQKLAQRFFGGHPTSAQRLTSVAHPVDGRPGMLFSLEIHYSIDHLPSSYDRVTALVVRLDDGSFVMAVSSIPNDADPRLQRLASASIDSLAVS